MRGKWSAATLAILLASAASAQPAVEPGPELRRLERWASPRLTRFHSEAEFRGYLRDLVAAQETRIEPIPMPAPPVVIMPAPPAPPPPPSAGAPPPPTTQVYSLPANVDQVINNLPQVIPGATNPQITNVQEQGVDEGDIVKQVGRFLLVLQDARIFSIDTAAGGGTDLALADRVDVYRSTGDRTWYDEMLVFGDRVVVTGYSYGEDASQFTVLRVDTAGRLTREATFFLSSDDYYDSDNYATRLIGERLVVYAPRYLEEVDLDEPWQWPTIRRWRPEDEQAAAARAGRPVMDARAIYRPVTTPSLPVIHTLSMCSLTPAAAAGDDLACETVGFIGPDESEMYVTPTDAWLWTRDDGEWDWDDRDLDDCAADFRPRAAQTAPGQLFRIPLRGGRLTVAGVRGEPFDQLSLAVIGDRFHALTRWEPATCSSEDEPTALSFASIPLSRLGTRLVEVPESDYAPVPDIGADEIENRFTDRYLIYGGRSGYGSSPPQQPLAGGGLLAVVPVGNPAAARLLTVPHGIIRAERVGNDIVVTGYRDPGGLEVSLVSLANRPVIASSVRLDGRYETEGRSHAFNSSVGADGSGLIAVPTAPRVQESGRWVWRSGASDISYLSVARRTLAPLGELKRSEALPRGDYRCEVSCVDWYGNSRPIFTGGRVFALTGTELVEGRVEGEQIREVQRLDLTQPPPR